MPGFQQFLDHPTGKNPPRDWNPLHHAAFVKDVDKVLSILDSQSSSTSSTVKDLILAKDLSGWTPVHLACCGSSGWALESSWTHEHPSYRTSVFSMLPPRKSSSYILDQDKIQEASCKILSLLIKRGADVFGDRKHLTPAHVAASTDMTSPALALALLGAPIDPHRPGSPYQWAKQQANDAKDNIYLLPSQQGKVWKRYCNLLGEDGEQLLKHFNSFLGSQGWEDPDGKSIMLQLALRMERKLALRLSRYQKVVQLAPGRTTIQLCPQCSSLGERTIMASFFPSSTLSTPDRSRAWVDCDLCKIFHALLPNYLPGTVKNLLSLDSPRSNAPPEDGFAKFNAIIDECGSHKVSIEYNRVPIRVIIFPGSGARSAATGMSELKLTEYPPDPSLHFMPVAQNPQLAKQWLSDCRSNHKDCSNGAIPGGFEATRSGSFPTRLIDVSRWKEKMVRICDTRNTPVPFTALSHRWMSGPRPNWVTQKSNLEKRLAWFSSAPLPRSIKDALQATADLGIQYTWIDSICIVQDDTDDWEREAEQMASIYAHAERKGATPFYPVALRVEREGGSDAENASLPTIVRYAYDVLDKPLQVSHGDGESDAYLHHQHAMVSVREDVNESHLSDRGWILQERLLSRRSLHFGSSQMYWECPSTTVSEAGETIEKWWLQESIVSGRQALAGSSTSLDDARHGWKDIVSTYSRLKLTHPSDRLPAIAGIAKAFSTFLDDTHYLSGAWSKTFHEDLIWQVDHPMHANLDGRDALVISRSDKLPSWSWASVNAAVTCKLKTPRVLEGGCIPDCSSKCYRASLPLEWTRCELATSKITLLQSHPVKDKAIFSSQPDVSVTVQACMRSVVVLGPVPSKLGYLEAGFTPVYSDEMAPIGLAFYDEPGKLALCSYWYCAYEYSADVEVRWGVYF
ncbi:ankyrin repeat-containing protein [Podospora aff. communis PSN243]|uniref:Ankyrin repeat-containing protein n=1 Tax=Podospora aff. communis PSN243 TaxID=3040156 RepID=A0AAV9GC48_9PEZI|nr:ankyrin repeat-containing protein [Podospora aff. communis PSN243]